MYDDDGDDDDVIVVGVGVHKTLGTCSEWWMVSRK